MMYLIEILLPQSDNEGQAFAPEKVAKVRETLTDRFGGVTAFTRAPAKGTISMGGKIVHDDILVFETMVGSLETEWWARYRKELEREFTQDEIVIRATVITRL